MLWKLFGGLQHKLFYFRSYFTLSNKIINVIKNKNNHDVLKSTNQPFLWPQGFEHLKNQ